MARWSVTMQVLASLLTASYRTSGVQFWVTARPSTNDPFSSPVPLTALDSRSGDEDLWLSPDQRTVYFTSPRGGSYDIFVATR